jgi:hypothetical protein
MFYLIHAILRGLFGWAGAVDSGETPDENLGPYREPSQEDMRDSDAWKLKMLLKRAKALEQRGEFHQAIHCLEEFIAKANQPKQIEMARAWLESIRVQLPSE